MKGMERCQPRHPLVAVPGALVQCRAGLQFKLVPGEETGTVYVQNGGSSFHRRRPQPHLYLPQVREWGVASFWDPEAPTSLSRDILGLVSFLQMVICPQEEPV